MSAEDLARVLLKVTGLFWLLEAAIGVPSLFALSAVPAHPDFPDPQGMFLLQVVALLLSVAAATALLFATTPIVRLMRLGSITTPPALDGRVLQVVGFSLLGVWLVGSALPELAAFLAELLPRLKFGRELERMAYWRQVRSGLVRPAVELAIGLGLFFGARGLAGLWHGLRPLRPSP